MTVVDGTRSDSPSVRGITDTSHPRYTAVLARIREVTRRIARHNMTLVDYQDALRLLADLDGEGAPVVAPRDPHMHRKVLSAYTDFRQKLRRSAEPRVREVCERALLAVWRERTGKRTPDTRPCLFVVSNFRSYWEPGSGSELAALLPLITLSRAAGEARHRLVTGPVWLHEFFLLSWTRPGSPWRGFAEDVPSGETILGPGPFVPADDGEEVAMIAALWNDDPSSEYFDLATVREAARLLS